MEDKNKDIKVLNIFFNHSWGGHPKDRKFWTAIFEDGTLFDYNPKEALKKDIEKEGWYWQVLRYHKNGSISIMETNVKQEEL